MYRILVLDDEKIVLDSVQYIIENNYENFEIETARNGKEGLIKLDSFKPHIIMTDIRMPGISGLEFIKKARKIDNNVKILIVTAFEQFEYAKESFKFNVEDYILKPLSKKKLIEALDRTIEEIKLEKERRDEELESIEKYYSSIALVESNLFNSIILKRNYVRNLQQYRSLLSVDLLQGYIVAIKFTHLQEEASLNHFNDYTFKMNDCNEYLKTHIKYNYDSIVSNIFVDKIFIYIENGEDSESLSFEFWKNIHDKLLKKFGLKTKIGIGKNKDISEIYDSYEEAETILKLSDSNIAVYTEATMGSMDLTIFTEICDQILYHFKRKDKKIFDVFSELKVLYMSNYGKSIKFRSAEYNLLELLILLYGEMKLVKIYEKEVIENKTYIHDFSEKNSLEKINYFEKQLKVLFEDYIKSGGHSYSEITTKVLKKIETSFKEELSLEETANAVNVTPQYLSKLFKEETGKSFKELIIELRISEAKKLLKNSDLSIRKIAYEIGYNDPNYFIRIFKKNTGLTPKEYQRVIEK